MNEQDQSTSNTFELESIGDVTSGSCETISITSSDNYIKYMLVNLDSEGVIQIYMKTVSRMFGFGEIDQTNRIGAATDT